MHRTAFGTTFIELRVQPPREIFARLKVQPSRPKGKIGESWASNITPKFLLVIVRLTVSKSVPLLTPWSI